MYQRILVPVDGSPTSNRGLDEAIGLAKLSGGRLRLVHVVDGMIFTSSFEPASGQILSMLTDAGAKVLADARARVEATGVPVDTDLPETFGGRVCDVVNAQAQRWHADLIVLGTHGRRGIGRLLLGSDAEQVVRTASIPVLLVRPDADTAGSTPVGTASGAMPAAKGDS